ncbi:protein kinase [Streptomyces yaanensis]|uniref:non-specific serine/threonine protein kinase n=1 Tax=Streptomyces yaanensis TaxID=1142239 RepID=A0ABV7SBE6_9ACTN|nr:protein kinase [Streptomyces sp. CGMCC 4.7035]WNB96592.1 protein kinase [Streptomyces sp. CGMCC 4.7035]
MGEVFAGRYELVDPIGRGGVGAVWRAWDHRRRRYVAAKVLQQSDAHALLRFVREQALRIDHPHVLAPASWAADDDKVLFTMDLVGGGSLVHLVGDYGPLPPAFVCTLLDQLLSGLSAVHAEGVVHRDIKPANVLLEATGTARPRLRLSDFGIAMRLGEARLTETDYVVGTPGYLAPEQLMGAEPDFPADLFAVGLVALYLLEGAKPDARALIEYFVAHGTPGAPRGVPGPLWEVVATLLQPDPSARFRTATGARKALATAAELLPEPAPDDERVEIFDQLGPLPAGFGPEGPLRRASGVTNGSIPASPPAPASPPTPGTASMLGTTPTPGTATTPGTAPTPGTATTLGTTPTPGTATTPGTAPTLGTPLTPGTASALGTPGTLGTPLTPGTTPTLGTPPPSRLEATPYAEAGAPAQPPHADAATNATPGHAGTPYAEAGTTPQPPHAGARAGDGPARFTAGPIPPRPTDAPVASGTSVSSAGNAAPATSGTFASAAPGTGGTTAPTASSTSAPAAPGTAMSAAVPGPPPPAVRPTSAPPAVPPRPAVDPTPPPQPSTMSDTGSFHLPPPLPREALHAVPRPPEQPPAQPTAAVVPSPVHPAHTGPTAPAHALHHEPTHVPSAGPPIAPTVAVGQPAYAYAVRSPQAATRPQPVARHGRRAATRRPGPPAKVAVPVLLLALACFAVGFWALMRI